MSRIPMSKHGRPCGQRPEPLPLRLRNLLRDYRRDLGIFKELIQNADDARASEVLFILDPRQHEAASLPDPRMSRLMGPALLCANDSMFSPTDREHIETIGDSSKTKGGPKIGRFGLGFNTVYNITDHPSFLSGQEIVCFDPYCNAVSEEGQPPGYSWLLADLWPEYADWPEVFLPGGLAPQAPEHKGTIFRFPMRTREQADEQARESAICPDPFLLSDFQSLLARMQETGATLLLFTRNVLRLEVRQVNPQTQELERLWAAETINADEVRAARARLYPPGQEVSDLIAEWRQNPAQMPWVSYRQLFKVSIGSVSSEECWQVVAGMFSDLQGEILNLAHEMRGERVIPWAGAAAKLTRDGDRFFAQPIDGQFYCGMPLPQRNGHPIHLNGHFEVHSSRQRITAGDDEGRQVRWNDLLLKHAVSAAYVELLDSLRTSAGTTHPQSWYTLWPKASAEPLAVSVYGGLAQRPTIRTRQAETYAWARISNVPLPPAKRREDLQDALLGVGVPLPEPPLASNILDGFAQAGVVAPELSPAALRKRLKEPSCTPPKHAVRLLLGFCLADDKQELVGLPLALLANGEVQTFGSKPIWLATEEQIALFPEHRGAFLDPLLRREFKLKEDRNTKLMTFTPETVVAALHKYPRSTDRDTVLKVLRYLGTNKQLNFKQGELKKMAAETPLIPDQSWKLQSANCLTTPLIWRTDLDRRLLTALNTLGVPLVPEDEELHETLVTLRGHHPDLIYELTAADLIDTLTAIEPHWQQQAAEVILDFLADDGTLLRDETRIERLRSLPLLPTADGDLVAAETPRIFLPGGFEPPFQSTDVRILKLGSAEQRQPLYHRLGLQTMTLSSYVRTVLLKAADLASVAVLRWLADHYAQLDEEARSALRATPLARAQDGTLYPAQMLYAPEVVSAFLPGKARWLDTSALGSDSALLIKFIRELGLRDRPSAEDLLARIQEIIASTDAETNPEAADILGRICEYISNQWGALANKSGLSDKLANLKWVPALRKPRQQAVLGFVPPRTHLFRPNELYLADRIHLIGSQAPLCSPTLDSKFRKDLGFRTELQQVPLEMVLEHFAHLLNLYDEQPEDRARAQQIALSLREIYQFIGQRCKDKQDETERVRQRFGQRRCIWIAETGRLWEPKHVFSASVSYLAPWRAWLGEANPGLDVLGRRREPDIADLCAVLDEIAKTKVAPLPSADREIVLRILRRLYEMPGEIPPDVKVLTQQQHLAPAPSVYLDDVPWRHILAEKAGLLLLDSDATRAFPDIDKRTGVRLLSSCLVEVLSDGLAETQDEDARKKAYQLEARLHTPSFIWGLRRLLQALRVMKYDLGWVGKLRIVALDKVTVDCHLTNPEILLGQADDDMFYDTQEKALYVAAHQVRRMPLFVARALSRQLGAMEQEPLKAMLECDLHDIPEELNVRRIPPMISSDDEEIPSWLQTEEEEPAPHESTTGDEPGDTGSAEQTAQQPSDESTCDVPDKPAEVMQAEKNLPPLTQSPDLGSVTGVAPSSLRSAGMPGFRRFTPSPDAQGAEAASESLGASLPSRTPTEESGPQILRPIPPTEPGASRSSSGPPLTPGDGTSHIPRGSARGHLRSYAHPAEPSGTSNTEEWRETSVELNRAALQEVMRDALERGWSAERAGPNDIGYDVKLEIPDDAEPRFVAAKGLRGAWDGIGVALTKGELKEAQERGERYWLMVVEYALDPKKALPTPIQDPWNKLDEIRFDEGWREVADSRPVVQPTEGATLYEGDVRIGEIKKLTPMSPMLRLSVETSEGITRQIFYNPSQHRVVSAEKTDGHTDP